MDEGLLSGQDLLGEGREQLMRPPLPEGSFWGWTGGWGSLMCCGMTLQNVITSCRSFAEQ